MDSPTEQLGSPAADREPRNRGFPERDERTLEEELEEAANVVGRRFEADLALQPISREAAEEIMDRITWRLGRIDVTTLDEESADPDTLKLLERQLKQSADSGREAAKLKLRKSGVPTRERRRVYAEEIAASREAALFDKRPYSAVTLHWLGRDDNAERVLKRLEELRIFQPGVPGQHRSAA